MESNDRDENDEDRTAGTVMRKVTGGIRKSRTQRSSSKNRKRRKKIKALPPRQTIRKDNRKGDPEDSDYNSLSSETEEEEEHATSRRNGPTGNGPTGNVTLQVEEESKEESRDVTSMRFSNDCMEKNADNKVEISRAQYDPYLAKPQRAWTRQLLGGKVGNYTEEKIKEIEDWCEQLRGIAGTFFRTKVREQMRIIAREKSAFSELEEISEAWENAILMPDLLQVGEVLDTINHGGVFAGDWQKTMEAAFMEKHHLVYDDSIVKKKAPCLQVQATRAKCDVYKFLQEPGRKAHGYICSRRGANVKNMEGYGKRIRKKAVRTFDPSFVRQSDGKVREHRTKKRKSKAIVQTTRTEREIPMVLDVAQVSWSCVCKHLVIHANSSSPFL